MKYESYVFDLYGTLVDIHTEEGKDELWEKLALFHGYYDAHCTPEELKQRYGELVSGKEKNLKNKLDLTIEKKDDVHESHPEIKIEQVFAALFEEKGVVADEALAIHAGQFFRILSTEYVRLYEGVIKVLGTLKASGSKVQCAAHFHGIRDAYTGNRVLL